MDRHWYRLALVAGLAIAGVVATSSAQAALSLRLGGKAVYDDVADLTWLQDANYARTHGYSPPNGWLIWDEANTWAANLDIDGVTGWRLPGGDVQFDWNQSASEFGNLYYNVLGGIAHVGIPTPNASFDFFANIGSIYWSSVAWDERTAWWFEMGGGDQDIYPKDVALEVWAVHSGDVGLRPVPVPTSLVLLGPLVAAIPGLNRRRRGLT